MQAPRSVEVKQAATLVPPLYPSCRSSAQRKEEVGKGLSAVRREMFLLGALLVGKKGMAWTLAA
jgi:hypothetical protein